MGFNTTVLVLNDALHEIANDPKFGEKLVAAILHLQVIPGPLDVSVGNHVNAASAVETHHADGVAIVAVGGNTAATVGNPLHWTVMREPAELKEKIVRELAQQLGLVVSRKPIRKARK